PSFATRPLPQRSVPHVPFRHFPSIVVPHQASGKGGYTAASCRGGQGPRPHRAPLTRGARFAARPPVPAGPPSGARDGFGQPHPLSGQPNRGASGVRVYRQRLTHEVLIARGERNPDGDRAPFREGPADGVV